MIEKKTSYTPRNDLEEIGVEGFKMSPNSKMISDLLDGDDMKDYILGIAEKSFVDGFVIAFKTLGLMYRRGNNE